MKVPQTKAEKFEFEPWPSASKFVSWKVSFRREEISGSTHPRLISDWSAQIDLATGIEDKDHSGFIFDKHQIECETLDSKTTKGIMKTFPAEFKRKINFLEETQYKNRRSVLTGRQITFFNIKKDPAHIPTARWVSRKKTKAATTKCGCISLTLTRVAITPRSTNTPGKYT